jgi:hypothetical protein
VQGAADKLGWLSEGAAGGGGGGGNAAALLDALAGLRDEVRSLVRAKASAQEVLEACGKVSGGHARPHYGAARARAVQTGRRAGRMPLPPLHKRLHAPAGPVPACWAGLALEAALPRRRNHLPISHKHSKPMQGRRSGLNRSGQ